MTDIDEVAIRALVDAAEHESVTAELLTGGNRYTQFSLYDEPVVRYLETNEQPQYMFFNEMKGIGVGTKGNTITPDSSGLTIMTITDRRTLALVGQETGDERFEIPHDSVTGVEYSTGLMKHRLVIRTTETTYHLWIDSSYEESALSQATEALRRYRAQFDERGDTSGSDSNSESEEGTVSGFESDARQVDSSGRSSATERTTATDTGTNSTTDTSNTATDTDTDTDTTDSSNDTQPDNDSLDPLETLERLAELRDAGVLSEDEFTRKKQELLEQI